MVPSATFEDVDNAFELAHQAQKDNDDRKPKEPAQPNGEAIDFINAQTDETVRLPG
jgi:hypothetical protein